MPTRYIFVNLFNFYYLLLKKSYIFHVLIALNVIKFITYLIFYYLLICLELLIFETSEP